MSVYTTVTEAELRTYLSTFDAGDLVAFEGISAGIENTNYFVDTTCGRYVLTLFEQHGFESLDYFLRLMAWLSESGVATAHPLAGKDGQYLRLLCGKPASLVQRLRGRSVDCADSSHCAVVGRSLAKLHHASRGFAHHRANDRDLDWMQAMRSKIAPLADATILAIIDDELDFQQQQDFSTLPMGVIHADLFLDNVLFDGEELTGIIDLYYACHGAWLYDVAVTMNDWCRTPALTINASWAREFLLNYASERPWSESEKQHWPAVARRAALRFFLSRLYDKLVPREGELTQTKDPLVFQSLLLWLRDYCPALVG
jgi:homoserine kinase type II